MEYEHNFNINSVRKEYHNSLNAGIRSDHRLSRGCDLGQKCADEVLQPALPTTFRGICANYNI